MLCFKLFLRHRRVTIPLLMADNHKFYRLNYGALCREYPIRTALQSPKLRVHPGYTLLSFLLAVCTGYDPATFPVTGGYCIHFY